MTYANIYTKDGEWCYALWINGEFDHSDVIGCLDEASAEEATSELRESLRIPDLEVKVLESNDL